ncbi:MAG: hypothetical protein ACU0DT_20245 [Albimonas sp.]|tara:strand:+ start:152 stop:274 length:123 start_codon:yes stop_codon:yes gene_type:complete
MSKKVWIEPKVAKLPVKVATRGIDGDNEDLCGGDLPVDCS